MPTEHGAMTAHKPQQGRGGSPMRRFEILHSSRHEPTNQIQPCLPAIPCWMLLSPAAAKSLLFFFCKLQQVVCLANSCLLSPKHDPCMGRAGNGRGSNLALCLHCHHLARPGTKGDKSPCHRDPRHPMKNSTCFAQKEEDEPATAACPHLFVLKRGTSLLLSLLSFPLFFRRGAKPLKGVR